MERLQNLPFRACKFGFTTETTEKGHPARVLYFLKKLPRSIEDAMTLVWEVKWYYLGVDSLCIQ